MLEKMRKILAEQLDLDEASITLESRFKEDLEADSLDAVEIIMAIEDEYSIEIPDETAEEFKTVGDIVKCVEDLVNL